MFHVSYFWSNPNTHTRAAVAVWRCVYYLSGGIVFAAWCVNSCVLLDMLLHSQLSVNRVCWC